MREPSDGAETPCGALADGSAVWALGWVRTGTGLGCAGWTGAVPPGLENADIEPIEIMPPS